MKLNINIIQRLTYVLGIILWSVLWYLDDLDEIPNKTLDWVWFVPNALLAFQVLYNNKWMWLAIFCLISIYTFMLTILTTKLLIRGNTDQIIVLIIFAISTFAVWLLKPKQVESFFS